MALPVGERVLTPAEKKFYSDSLPPLQNFNENLTSVDGDAPLELPDPRLVPPVNSPWRMLPMLTPGPGTSQSTPTSVYQSRRVAPYPGRAPPTCSSDHVRSQPSASPGAPVISQPQSRQAWESALQHASSGAPIQSQPQALGWAQYGASIGSSLAPLHAAAPPAIPLIPTAMPGSLPTLAASTPTAATYGSTLMGCIPTPMQHDDSLRR